MFTTLNYSRLLKNQIDHLMSYVVHIERAMFKLSKKDTLAPNVHIVNSHPKCFH